MKKAYNKLTCLFGYHQYGKEPTKDKRGFAVRLCAVCGRSGYRKWDNGTEEWYGYDAEGNLTHKKWDDGYEAWLDYDKEGSIIHAKYSNGEERWTTNDRKGWVTKKPKNWIYENV